MKVALLVCDHVRAEFAKVHGDYPIMFRRLLPNLEMDDWFVCDGLFPEVDNYDAFICTGSKYSVYDNIDWINNLADLVRAIYVTNKKFMGICFGHQMMAHALGGEVKKSEHGYLIGVHEFEVSEKPDWVSGIQDSFNVLMLCQDQVQQLPPNSKVLASSESCPVGMFTIGANFLGIQGHPEYTKEFNQALFESRPEKIAESNMEKARSSFKANPSKERLARAISQFLTY